jgi:hypothetical protein
MWLRIRTIRALLWQRWRTFGCHDSWLVGSPCDCTRLRIWRRVRRVATPVAASRFGSSRWFPSSEVTNFGVSLEVLVRADRLHQVLPLNYALANTVQYSPINNTHARTQSPPDTVTHPTRTSTIVALFDMNRPSGVTRTIGCGSYSSGNITYCE